MITLNIADCTYSLLCYSFFYVAGFYPSTNSNIDCLKQAANIRRKSRTYEAFNKKGLSETFYKIYLYSNIASLNLTRSEFTLTKLEVSVSQWAGSSHRTDLYGSLAPEPRFSSHSRLLEMILGLLQVTMKWKSWLDPDSWWRSVQWLELILDYFGS